MLLIARDLVWRAVSTGNQTQQVSQSASAIFQLPRWGATLLMITIALYMFLLVAFSYTLDVVVPWLAIIETPSIETEARTSIDDFVYATEHDVPLLNAEGPGDIKPASTKDGGSSTKARAITSSIRNTISYLRLRAGLFSVFRGFHVAVLYQLCAIILAIPFFLLSIHLSLFGLPYYSGAEMALEIIITVLLCPIHLWWNQAVVSAQSQGDRSRWQMLFRALSMFTKIALPTLAWAVAQELSMLPVRLVIYYTHLPGYILAFALVFPESVPPQQLFHALFASLAVMSVKVVCLICIEIPSNVMLFRVYASLLPEHSKTIVPCDRTFAGKVIPEAYGGSEQLGMMDALRTFGRAAWVRIFKLYAKIIAIHFSAVLVFIMLLGLENWYNFHVMGKGSEAAASVAAAVIPAAYKLR
ncbi:hypothetical protein MMC11_005156 [Xylographa trunciseda]|nr:hypothetical protein [Xylographa trunciseda]